MRLMVHITAAVFLPLVILAGCRAATSQDTPADVSTQVSAASVVRMDYSLDGYSAELTAKTDIRAGMPLRAAHAVIYKLYAPDEGGQNSDFVVEGETHPDTGQYVTLIRRDNMKDDSVRAIEFKTLSGTGAQSAEIVEFGARVKCRRGDNTTRWQTKLCP